MQSGYKSQFFNKKEACVVRRSSQGYYSQLQTAASAMKYTHDDDLISQNKTVKQREQDIFDD